MLHKIIFLNRTAYQGRMIEGGLISLAWFFHAVCEFVFILTIQRVYDVYQKEGYGENLVWALLLLGVCLALDQLSITLGNALMENGSYLIVKGLSGSLQEVVRKKNAIEFEKTAYLNSLEQAQEGIENATYLLNIVQMVFFFQIPYLFLVGTYLLKQHILLFVAFALISIPECVNQMQKKKRYQKLAENLASLEREYKVYEEMIVSPHCFVETRVLGGGFVFRKLLQDVISRMSLLKDVEADKTMRNGIVAHLLSIIFYGMAILILAKSVAKGTMTVGALTAVLSSFTTVSNLVQNLVNQYWGQIMEQSGNVSHLISFLEEECEEEDTKNITEIDSLIVSNLSFRYPGNDFDSLKNISFRSDKKEIIAVVGENGAGKTTLLKVMSGLLANDRGNVFINGIKADVGMVGKYSFVFQNYQKYALSLKENVCFDAEENDEIMDELMGKVGLIGLAEKLEKGYGTMLTKEFGNTELSGGQWQRVAIARGIRKQSEILVLDEPTAAIDPMEESSLYRLILDMGRDRRTFVVTHRMGICRYVDRILVLKEGELVEDGTHEELMEKKGVYHQLFHKQADLYCE